jgi:CHAD domain-containing protein
MPRNVRGSQGSKAFGFALRTVLKATSQLRDMDTLMDTLRSHKDGLLGGLLVNLDNQRSDAAARAKVAIGALAEAPAPKLDASELRGKRLSKKLRKGLRKHSREASSLLTEVLSDESKAVELHSLRKEVKKIRYLTELAARHHAQLSSLTKWQESLGAIHDIDVAIAYLKGVGANSGRTILELQRVRHAKYQTFVRDYGATRAPGAKGAFPVGALAPAGRSPVKG